MSQNTQKLVFSFFLTFAAAGIGSAFTGEAIDTWYAFLNKPAFTPPDWIFAPVWTTLYILMATALYFVWQKAKENALADFGVVLFIVHLFFNAGWSIVFFGMQDILSALIVIFVLDMLITALIILFHKIKPLAAYLLFPYLAWSFFATILNYSLWILN